jgi:hypothetical protein
MIIFRIQMRHVNIGQYVKAVYGVYLYSEEKRQPESKDDESLNQH